ncbi:hypothetical protein RUM44_006677 [Polyplax serrata]|uniref:Protein hairy n=1 Tax=Polyplax serrata TaxID=468196 RepID=A0ABR1AIU0_POLSC
MVAGGGTMASAPPPAIGGNGGCTSVSANTSNLPGSTSGMPSTPQGTNEGGPTRTRTSENRRSNKPIMEKRRRARINNCLNELKTLILDAMKKDPARHSKLEKADILEMTVKHLEALQRQQVAMAAATDPNVANKFRAGFTECAGEVGRFPGLEGPVKRRLLQHLANCLNSSGPLTGGQEAANAVPPTPVTPAASANSPLQVHIVRTTQSETPLVQQTNSSNIILANTNGQGVQLVPTRLPNGDIALILPSSNSFRSARTTVPVTPASSPSPSVSSSSSGSSPLPMLIPIPHRSNTNSPPIALDRLSMNSSSPPRQITIVTTQNPQRILIPQPGDSRNVPLVAYQCNDEHVIQQRVMVSDSYTKQEKVIKSYDQLPVMRDVDPSVMQTRKNVIESVNDYGGSCERSPSEERRLYEGGSHAAMTHEPQLIERERSPGYVTDKGYTLERETLLHIPEREYYDSGMQSVSPRSPHIAYVDAIDENKYRDYYSDHYEPAYSPEMPKPLALVTKKKCQEFGSEERPWRPW